LYLHGAKTLKHVEFTWGFNMAYSSFVVVEFALKPCMATFEALEEKVSSIHRVQVLSQ
jgi:hypothetical protein